MTIKRRDIRLDRRFFELTRDDEPLPGSLAQLARTLSWEQVLARPCSVILGEAGTGKTTEFRQRCDLLVAAGSYGFLVTVEDLAADGLVDSLTAPNAARLSAWRDSAERGYFFLDSLDEARLNGQRFQSALRKLQRELEDGLARAAILISCRVSDWRAKADRDTIATALFPEEDATSSEQAPKTPTAPAATSDVLDLDLDGDGWADTSSDAASQPPRVPSSDPIPTISVCALAPLDERQIGLLAKNLGVEDPEPFIAAARRASAHAYLERPRDVEWIAAYWLQHGEFGTLTELVENDVQEKLRERNPQRKPSLSAARAREAVQVLAGIAALKRCSTFSLPDGDLDADRASTSIDPVAYLPDLTKQEINELLSLPVFDESTYGRVRIHHRTVSEYLAAQWLLSLVQRGLSPAELHALLLRDGPSGPVVPLELLAVAAWVANTNEDLRNRLLDVAPAVLLDGGDPNAFPDEVRKDLLLALAKKYRGRQRLYERFDASALRRLATGSLAETVNQLLVSETSEELLDTLLTLVGEGVLLGCAAASLRLAREPTTPRHARLEAIRAAAVVGSRSENESLIRSLVDDAIQIDHEVGGAVVAAMYPTYLSLEQLLVLVARVEPPPPQTGTTLPYWLGHRVCNDTRPELRATLLDGVLSVVNAQPRSDWLLDPLAQIAIQYAADHHGPVQEPLLRLVRFFVRLQLPRTGVGDGSEEIRRLIASSLELRRVAFWEDVAVLRERGKNPTRFYDLLVHEHLWALGAEDFDWLETDACSMPRIQDRLLAFDTLARASVGAEDEVRKQAAVLRLVATEPAFAKRYERWNRPGEPSAAMVRLQRQQRIRQERRAREQRANLATLKENIDNIRAGHEGILEYLAGVSDIDGQEPGKAIERLRKRFDDEVADAAVVGFRNLWRVRTCPLPHEEPERNRWLVITVAGLAGVTLDLESGLDARMMRPDEATQAARYATRSMNRFPAWLDQLASSHPSEVSLVFGAAISADYQHAPDQQPIHSVLYLLGHASLPVRQLCAPLVLLLLEAGDPMRFDTLEQAVEALIPTPTAHDALGSLAQSRCASLRPVATGASPSKEYILWLCAWLAVAPDHALGELESQVCAAGGTAAKFVEQFSDQLYRVLNDARLEFPIPTSSDQLVRLYAVVAGYVRPSEDVHHLGTYSPGPRDHAESLRTFLLDRLVAIEGDATYLGLRRLADDHRLLDLRDYLLALADQRVAQDVGKRDPDVADRLESAFRKHGLRATDHLEEAGLRTMTSARVDFGLITALPEERDAVLAQLGSLKRLDKNGSDTHTYYEGTLSTARADGAVYRVVLVCCPSMGPEIAVQTAGALLNQWKPRHVMLVGIAMGLEGESHHGDILIADQVADYTLGKQENGERTIRWRGSQPGASLFDSAIALGTQWNTKILALRPAAGLSELVVGTVASGGDVVADKELVAAFLDKWPKLVGIEMEAGGVATAVHHDINKPDFLMIKGVSDHGYDKNFPEVLPWRAYAGAAAAAFAIELMRCGPSPAIKPR